jgi:hypothetical protein
LSAAIVLFLTVVAGGLAAMAQWARNNPRAEVTLYVILLAVSFMAAGVGVLSGLGLVTEASRGTVRGTDATLYLVAGFVSILGTMASVYLSLRQILRLQRRPPSRSERAAERSDPPVFFALWLVVLAVAYNVSGLLAYTATSEELGAALSGTSGLSPGGVLAAQLPLLIVAGLGVGLFVNRGPRAVLARLGYGEISARQLGVVAAFGVGAYTLSIVADRLFASLQPGLYERAGSMAENVVIAPELGLPVGIVVAILVGVALALGEETLLRGAVQPYFGIAITALLSATLQVQYGLSPILVYLFLLSVGLGLLRRRFGTTASFLAHALYNALVIGGTNAFG